MIIKFTPLKFQAPLAAGGISLMAFNYLQFAVPHGKGLLKNHFAENIVLNGHTEQRLPNTLNVSFLGQIGQDILAKIPGLAASTGSACHAGTVELSSVLKAMKVDERIGKGTIRFSLGRYTTKEEIDLALEWLKEAV